MLIIKTKHHKHSKLLPDIGLTRSNLVLRTSRWQTTWILFVLTNCVYIIQADIYQ